VSYWANNIYCFSQNNIGVIYLKDNINLYEIFEEHMMQDEKPSIYFEELAKEEWFLKTYPYSLLGALINTEQSPVHHPEGSVWKHTMMVLDNAAERRALSKNPKAFLWAALLHDLGKAPTTKIRKGKITSYDHDKVGENLALDFLKEYTSDADFLNEVSKLVRWHMQILFVNKNLPFADIKDMSKETSITEIALLGECDRLGRGGLNKEKILEEEKNIEMFKKKCEEYQKA
jgi:tRNA nucleotidyltransferase (CCA-adding enzyme)